MAGEWAKLSREAKDRNNARRRSRYRKHIEREHAVARRYREANIERERARKRRNYRELKARVLAAEPKGISCTEALHRNPVFVAANGAVPRSYPTYVRDDIVSEIVLAVLEKRVALDEVERCAAEFIRGYWRQFSQYREKSLDAPVPGRTRQTYHDIIEVTL